LKVTKIEEEDWRLFLALFKSFMMHYSDLWIINNDLFKRAVIKYFTKDVSIKYSLHEDIADTLEDT
jgi:hypothetical protein